MIQWFYSSKTPACHTKPAFLIGTSLALGGKLMLSTGNELPLESRKASFGNTAEINCVVPALLTSIPVKATKHTRKYSSVQGITQAQRKWLLTSAHLSACIHILSHLFFPSLSKAKDMLQKQMEADVPSWHSLWLYPYAPT